MDQLLSDGTLGGVTLLLGKHYEAVSWCMRVMGATVGKRVYWPGSGVICNEHDLLHVGDDVVFGSRSTVLCADTKECAAIKIGAGCFVADRCVILPGESLSAAIERVKRALAFRNSALSHSPPPRPLFTTIIAHLFAITSTSQPSPGVTMERSATLGSGGLAHKSATIPAGSVWVGSARGKAVVLSEGNHEKAMKEPTIRPFGKAFYRFEGYKASYFVLREWMVIA
jgi:acetyltransferase-like isoleucine patch superfamily enzyme